MIQKKNYNHLDARCMEKPTNKPSMTVPDEALSVREIFARHSRGMSTVASRAPHFDDDPDFDSEDGEKVLNEDLYDRELLVGSIQDDRAVLEKEEKRILKEKKERDAAEAAELDELKRELRERKKSKKATESEKESARRAIDQKSEE